METITQALKALWALLLDLIAAVVSVIAIVEEWLHIQMSRFGVPSDMQSVIMILAAVVLVLIAFRALKGLLRLLLVLVLILFAIHVVMPLLRQYGVI